MVLGVMELIVLLRVAFDVAHFSISGARSHCQTATLVTSSRRFLMLLLLLSDKSVTGL